MTSTVAPLNDTTITINMAPFNPITPTIDLAEVSMAEVFAMYQILSAASDLISASTNGRSRPVTKYLDDWQALLFAACSDMADVVHAIAPTEDISSRSFFLASMRIRVAEGPVDICGPGAPESWEGGAK